MAAYTVEKTAVITTEAYGDVTVLIEAYYDIERGYGADADGNGGEDVAHMEDFEIIDAFTGDEYLDAKTFFDKLTNKEKDALWAIADDACAEEVD